MPSITVLITKPACRFCAKFDMDQSNNIAFYDPWSQPSALECGFLMVRLKAFLTLQWAHTAVLPFFLSTARHT